MFCQCGHDPPRTLTDKTVLQPWFWHMTQTLGMEKFYKKKWKKSVLPNFNKHNFFFPRLHMVKVENYRCKKRLKGRPRCQFSIPNPGFSISAIFSNIFYIFQNFLDFRYFSCVKILSTPNRNCSKFVQNLDFGSNTILQTFRMTKVDHIPYPDHNFCGWKLIAVGFGFWPLWIFTFFARFVQYSFTGLYRPFCEGPKWVKKDFFQLFLKWPV